MGLGPTEKRIAALLDRGEPMVGYELYLSFHRTLDEIRSLPEVER
jgi:hypothetical protein